jgi:hypothetical protein
VPYLDDMGTLVGVVWSGGGTLGGENPSNLALTRSVRSKFARSMLSLFIISAASARGMPHALAVYALVGELGEVVLIVLMSNSSRSLMIVTGVSRSLF